MNGFAALPRFYPLLPASNSDGPETAAQFPADRRAGKLHQGGGTCVKQLTAGRTISGDQILKDTQDTLKAGSLTVIQTNATNAKGILTVTNSAGASFSVAGNVHTSHAEINGMNPKSTNAG